MNEIINYLNNLSIHEMLDDEIDVEFEQELNSIKTYD